MDAPARESNEVNVSNQRSVRKVSSRKHFKMPGITPMGKRAKVSKGPAKKIGKE